MTGEPWSTAWFLLAVGALMAASVVVSRASSRLGVPIAMLFLAVGMLAGSDGIGRISFEDHALAYRVGTFALVLILFDGGLNTSFRQLRGRLAPALTLATAGVVATAGFVALGGRWLGLSWEMALLFGAIVSSTDAAAVFSVLRGGGLRLEPRVGTTLELESGLNDPLAVILTSAMTSWLVGTATSPLLLSGQVLLQLLVGAVGGLGIGWGARWLLGRLRVAAAGLYTVLTIGLAAFAYAAPTLLWGSGFLAVYLAGMVIGNGKLPYRSGLLRIHDAIAWLGQVSMFLLLGLLVFPSRLDEVALLGLGLALLLSLVARPLAVWLCLLPFRFAPREVGYIGWVGLRGAVPIVLAIGPLLAGVAGASKLFDLVFFVVVCNAFLPGATVRWVTRRLGMDSGSEPPPPAVLEVVAGQEIEGEVLSFSIAAASAVAGARISELPLPDRATVMMIVRGRELVPPRGDTELRVGDHAYVLCRAEDEVEIRLLFGQAES
jgi:cell volume regulation protein A